MPRETRDAAIARADKAERHLRATETALARLQATGRWKYFTATPTTRVVVTYPPKAGASEDSYQIVSVDDESGSAQLHMWETIPDLLRYVYRVDSEASMAMGSALDRAQSWVRAHMRGDEY